MPIWGTLLGFVFGFMFLKIPGAVLGLIVGHYFDRAYSQDFSQLGGFARFFTNPESFQQNAVFFHSLFALLGHIAKADGRVTEDEIAVATQLMNELGLKNDGRKEAQNAFREGKIDNFPLESCLKDLKEACHGRRDLLQIFLEILVQAALSDGRLASAEHKVLQKAAKHLGFSSRDLDYFISSYQAQQRFRQSGRAAQASSQQSIEDAYKILGVQSSDDEKTVKRAYKKRMAEHHPDKLAAKGLPAEAMEIAKQKTQSIQAAYSVIRESKKW